MSLSFVTRLFLNHEFLKNRNSAQLILCIPQSGRARDTELRLEDSPVPKRAKVIRKLRLEIESKRENGSGAIRELWLWTVC